MCHPIACISATATGISAAVANSKRPATFGQSAEPTAWRVVSIASCGGRAGFSDDGITEGATIVSNDLRRTWDAFSEATRVRRGGEPDQLSQFQANSGPAITAVGPTIANGNFRICVGKHRCPPSQPLW